MRMLQWRQGRVFFFTEETNRRMAHSQGTDYYDPRKKDGSLTLDQALESAHTMEVESAHALEVVAKEYWI